MERTRYPNEGRLKSKPNGHIKPKPTRKTKSHPYLTDEQIAARQKMLFQQLQGLARSNPRKRQVSREEFLRIFKPAVPPPGVLPKGYKIPEMAMDWIGNSTINASERIDSYYYSAYQEGQEFLGYAILVVLAQRPEYRVITETIASDMTREWIRFEASKNAKEDKTQKIAELEDYLEYLNLKGVVRQAILNDGFQGRGQIYIDLGVPVMDAGVNFGASEELKTSIGDGRDEISRAKIKKGSLKGFLAIEPMWTYPNWYNASQPLRPDWYRPETWFVMGSEVHRTRLITFIGRPVPDMLKPAYSFGGLSMTQMVKPYVDFWLRNRTTASDLLNGFSTMVLLTTLDVTSMTQASGDILWERIQTFNALRDNMGLLVLNKASEDFKNVSASLAGVHELVAQSQEHIASVAQIPTAKLLGIQPAGMNADSEGIIRLYYDRIRATQESLLRGPLTTIINIAQLSLWGENDPEIVFSFNPLWQLDEAGRAAIQLAKAQIIETDIASGVIDPEEGRIARATDPDSPYSGLDLHKEAPGEVIEKLQEEYPLESILENEELIHPKPESGVASRLEKNVESKSAEFGGAATGGFPAKDDLAGEKDTKIEFSIDRK